MSDVDQLLPSPIACSTWFGWYSPPIHSLPMRKVTSDMAGHWARAQVDESRLGMNGGVQSLDRYVHSSVSFPWHEPSREMVGGLGSSCQKGSFDQGARKIHPCLTEFQQVLIVWLSMVPFSSSGSIETKDRCLTAKFWRCSLLSPNVYSANMR